VRLETLDPYPKRLSVVDHPSGHTLVMDTAKASHWSTLSLIDDLQNWGPARRIFVLGEMSDIRNDASRRYRQVMKLLADRADLVIGIGGRSTSAARALDRANIVAAPTMKDLIDILRKQPPSLVILKSNKSLSLNPLATAEFSLSVDHPAPQ
jgi:UDP-N-acetylmuramyl pentapeptide synthase